MSWTTISQTALSGMWASETMLGVAADNLANLHTPGFQQSQLLLATRPAVGPPGAQVGTGVQMSAIVRDGSPGALLPASGELNLAISGDGYFVLEGSDGQQVYTRDGRFHANAEGQLVSSSGLRLLGVQGDPSLFQGALSPLFILNPRPHTRGADPGPGSFDRHEHMGPDGLIRRVLANGTAETTGQIRLARFNNPSGLRGLGNNLYQVTASSGPAHLGNPGTGGLGRLMARTREASTVDVAQNIIGMSRAELLFRANVKVLGVADEMSQELLRLLRR